MSSNKVIRKGPGIGKYIKRIKKAGNVDVGIIDAGTHDDSEDTVATIGFKNEFGDKRTPERSYFRSTLQDKATQIVALQVKLWKQVSKGTMEINKALGLVGLFVADEIKKKIVAIKSPPNAPSTIAKKGSSNPLIDSSQLKNSIIHEVNR